MESLKCFIRLRPEEGEQCIFKDLNSEKLTVVNRKESGTASSLSESTSTFEFDKIFDRESKQLDVWDHVKPLVHEALKGFTVTVFAFGMTGSGKSHTINGTKDDPGLVPRAVNHIFDNLKSCSSSDNREQVGMVCLSFVELYNNQLYDLLTPEGSTQTENGNLKIHEHPQRGVYLSGSSGIRTPVSTADEAIQLIEKGYRDRVTCSTNLNDRSSRSHTVISFEIVSREAISSSDKENINEKSTLGKAP